MIRRSAVKRAKDVLTKIVNNNVQSSMLKTKCFSLKPYYFAKLAVSRLRRQARNTTSIIPLAGIFSFFGSTAYAQEDSSILFGLIQSTEILMLAVFAGAMSFALMSATWLIRERGRMSVENANLKINLSELRARNDRNEALLNIPEQRIVVWNGSEEKPTVLGSLNNLSGSPEKRSKFLSFSSWLSSNSNSRFEPALRELRTNAKPFDMVISSNGGGIIEVQGRTSGSHAYVRFRELSDEREEYARIKYNYATLKDQFNNVESLCEKLPMPVWFRDKEGKITWVNQCFAEAVEYSSAEDVVQDNIDMFDKERAREIERVQENDGLYNDTVPVTVAGDRKKLEVFSVKGNNGSAGIAFDRSDFDTLSRTLSDVKASHSKMLDQIETAVAIFDKSQKLVFSNSSFQQLWNMDSAMLESSPSNAELLDAMRDAKLLPEHPDWRGWREQQLQIYKSIEPVDEWWHLLNGQTIRVTVTPRTEGGANWIFQNVTEQLALESNNKTLVRMQGETLDHLNEAVAVFASDGKLRLYNPALEELWTHSGIEVQEGLHIAKIISAWTDSVSNAADLENILGKITGFVDQRSNLNGRLEMLSESTIEYSLVPLPEGQAMLTFTDVTASVNFERALRERAEALEASDLLKSRFIQHVSYELRAPLTSIVGFGEMLSTQELGSLNEQQNEYLSYINTSAHELSTIVDDILDLASVDAGTMTLEFEQINLASIVANTIHEHDATITERSLKTNVQIDQACTKIIADENRLQQIINNLISNALSFSPDGGTVTIEAMVENENHVIRISDEGPGVAEDQKDTIFERFEARSPDGTRRGTGLGLSIVRSFVELHGGEVIVQDAPNRGACFLCRIPVSPQIMDSPTAGGYITHAAQ